MEEGKLCPLCNKDIGIWSVISASWPTRIKCPNCKSTLKYDIKIWRTLLIAILPLSIVLLFFSFGIIYFIFPNLEVILRIILSLALLLLLWLVFEWITALYVRKHKKLKIVRQKIQQGNPADTDKPSRGA